MTTDPASAADQPLRPGGPPDPAAERVHDALQELRASAEQRRHLVTHSTERQDAKDLQRLVQELQVHQIELEMQNEELLLAQAEAQAARAEFVDLYDFAPVGYFTLSAGGLIEQLNLCAARQLVTVRQRLQGRRFELFVNPAERVEFDRFLVRVQRADTTVRTELGLRRDDGSAFYGQLEGLRVEGPTGPKCRLVVLDVTARHEATQAHQVAEARFRATFEQSNDGMVLLDGHHLVDLNAAAQRLLGLPAPAQPIGQNLLQFWPKHQPDGRLTLTRLNAGLDTAAASGWCRLELQRPHPATSREVWDEFSFNPVLVQGRTLMHAVWRDVTAARHTREQLRLSEERLQLALNASASGVWRWEFSTDLLYWDTRAQEIFGRPYDANPAPFAVLREAIVPDDYAAVQAALQAAIDLHAPIELEYRVRWPDGAVHSVTALGKVYYDDQGRPLHLTGIMRDVTHRRQTQEQLRREKEFSESLLQHSIDGIAAFDREGRITAWNDELARYSRLPAAEVLGRLVYEVYPRFNVPDMYQATARVLAGEPLALPALRFTHREGEYNTYLVPLSKQDGSVSGILAIIRDVTERNRLAEEATRLRLRQQQEVLSAILSTQETERKRIAEALHNGLGQLLYATKLSLDNRGIDPAPVAEAQKLLNEAIRTTRTLSFELTPGILEDFGLRVALEELVKRISPRHLPIHLHLSGLEPALPPAVEIAAYRIVQELLNNVLKHAQATEVQIHVVREGRVLELTVEDNGVGFALGAASESLTGIGLAGIRNRVALLGGSLRINSEPGRGTIVSIELAA